MNFKLLAVVLVALFVAISNGLTIKRELKLLQFKLSIDLLLIRINYF